MKPGDRKALTADLARHVGRIASDLAERLRRPGSARDRARILHADEHVGEDFDLWIDLAAHRAAALWVLKSVYVRVLEDRGLISPGRLYDLEASQMFERLAPHLGETSFLRWIYRDLASPRGGLPELFGLQPVELVEPADGLSRDLIAFWRHVDVDTGRSLRFDEERFDGELLGDLYQDLDPVVKDRFALCQTPDFVRAFILDRTLTPAIEAFRADEVRVLDPACGSGHFLIDALKRLVPPTAALHPDWPRAQVVSHALDRIVGIDLNDYACALARARLVMTAAELAGSLTLSEAARFHPHVYWADGLEQVERDTPARGEDQVGIFEATPERPRSRLTRAQSREGLPLVLEPKFHAIVANPPYIAERDPEAKAYHRKKVGKTRRYVTAYREYHLDAPFTERAFQLAVVGGFVGLITSNAFMKREFGKPLIQDVLANVDLTLVVDTSQARFQAHGTPTVLLFARNRRPAGDVIRAVMGKRGEAGVEAETASGKVWSSILAGWEEPGYESDYVSVSDLPRDSLLTHPWSLGGGGAAELKQLLQSTAARSLGSIVELPIGRATRMGADDAFELAPTTLRALSGDATWRRPLLTGERIRDWATADLGFVFFPYCPHTLQVRSSSDLASSGLLGSLWPRRTILSARATFQGRIADAGLEWFEYMQYTPSANRQGLSIAFAFVATHNHFVLDRGGKVFNRSAPVIKLASDAGEDAHLALLGMLNSSAGCFWMKQVFHCKGLRGEGGGITATEWEKFYEFDSTKMRQFPIPNGHEATADYARALDALAQVRSAATADSVLRSERWQDGRTLRVALDERRSSDLGRLYRMIGLQEELDWLCYRLYGLEAADDLVPPEAVESMPPTWLPWVLEMAASGAPTAWFERHRWEPLIDLPAEAPPALRARVEARRRRIRDIPEIRLIECATYKRRWYRPDYDAEETEALRVWLADRVEDVARARANPFTLEQVVAELQDDPRVLAVGEVATGRRDFSLSALVAAVLEGESVPSHPFHVYRDSGLVKRAGWERTWSDQRREDAGERVTPEVPEVYKQSDFLRPEYWRLRGKLDVPKERFVAFREVPGRGEPDRLYGWAGARPLARLRWLLAIDEDLDDAGIPLADRIGVLDSAWRILPDAAKEDPVATTRLRAEIQAVVGQDGPSREMVESWRQAAVPARKARGARRS